MKRQAIDQETTAANLVSDKGVVVFRCRRNTCNAGYITVVDKRLDISPMKLKD